MVRGVGAGVTDRVFVGRVAIRFYIGLTTGFQPGLHDPQLLNHHGLFAKMTS